MEWNLYTMLLRAKERDCNEALTAHERFSHRFEVADRYKYKQFDLFKKRVFGIGAQKVII
jgi:hypothetical protein